MTERKIQLTDSLTIYDTQKLLEQMGIQKYLNQDECKIHSGKSEHPEGWSLSSGELISYYNCSIHQLML